MTQHKTISLSRRPSESHEKPSKWYRVAYGATVLSLAGLATVVKNHGAFDWVSRTESGNFTYQGPRVMQQSRDVPETTYQVFTGPDGKKWEFYSNDNQMPTHMAINDIYFLKIDFRTLNPVKLGEPDMESAVRVNPDTLEPYQL